MFRRISSSRKDVEQFAAVLARVAYWILGGVGVSIGLLALTDNVGGLLLGVGLTFWFPLLLANFVPTCASDDEIEK